MAISVAMKVVVRDVMRLNLIANSISSEWKACQRSPNLG